MNQELISVEATSRGTCGDVVYSLEIWNPGRVKYMHIKVSMITAPHSSE